MHAHELRKKFIDFFESHGHQVMASGPLVPDDKSLLFTNAGMVPFKQVFLGEQTLETNRATSSQCCIRAGGKHNDLDNVGYTARHHTFFEMLGNFSFGDYFKREAIGFAWQFLTETLQIPQEKLWITVFEEDHESEEIWKKEIGIDPERLSRCGAKDNFWAMGDTGPCGPCTEIFFDHGPEVAGGPPGSPDEDGDRYIEIWNLVFMQYNRSADGSMVPLPRPSVDTGMGLERMAAVLQGVHSNYETDLFTGLIAKAREVLQCPVDHYQAMCVIADHCRSSCFLLAEGVFPSNEGRGYVLRRIIRRALRHGYQISQRLDFMHELVPTLIEVMGDAYPHLHEKRDTLIEILSQEEQQFSRTLANGMQLLDKAIAEANSGVISGDLAFLLYDTYGFPLDLTEDIARGHQMTVDQEAFEQAMTVQRERSQGAGKFSVDYSQIVDDLGHSEFVGYETMSIDTQVIACVFEGSAVERLELGQEGAIVLAESPFYAESGGQVGDQGEIHFDHGVVVFKVLDTQKHGNAICLYGRVVSHGLKVGDEVHAVVDENRRFTRNNHSATHLLHAALRQVLGDQVEQKGSLVTPDKLRFDFSWPKALTDDQKADVEQTVNRVIQSNVMVETEIMALDEAKKRGAMALFGEKYQDPVRVLSMGGFSVELCGGTHVSMTGEIGVFKIISEEAVAQGIRRIEALTGNAALAWLNQYVTAAQLLSQSLNVPVTQVNARVMQINHERQGLIKKLASFQKQDRHAEAKRLISTADQIGDVRVIIAKLPDIDNEGLRDSLDPIRQSEALIAALLFTQHNDKLLVVTGVSKGLTARIHAGEWLKSLMSALNGKGGGRADLAQGGGIALECEAELRQSARDWLEHKLGS